MSILTYAGLLTPPDPAYSPAFSPATLFYSGEQGIWLDCSDLSTMFQDSAGTTPVTAVEQPVGLILDKRLGLVEGPDLVTNGTFDTDTSGWRAALHCTISAVGGRLRVTATGSPSLADYNFPTVVGRTYRIRANCVAGTATNPMFRAGAAALGIEYFALAGAAVLPYVERVFVATGTTCYVSAGTSGATVGQYADFDNISVRELSGNHAFQRTTAARPVLQSIGGKLALVYDGVDDKLTTTFPNLGSNATIARSVPGVGASILTGQTIGAGAWDDSTNHCGLVIVNRALTGPETASLTTYLNELAGV